MWKYWLALFSVFHNKTGNGTPPLPITLQTDQVCFFFGAVQMVKQFTKAAARVGHTQLGSSH